ncbi:pyridoxal-phosphate dependent enzyme [Kutzneria viridogrisea]|uniref:1-aminocyclopropane-1-carboxylate deaminase n=1 Tax=Kutzneria viridogrisea TaxID=47990 RepID=A0ABR6BMW3_9PSEU|nr:1-aminocyclopropane-1-carboxylate deaminase [Kutzneria viridogrisea]
MPHSPLNLVHDERLARLGVTLHLKRDDLIHPELTGNKWRKLKHNLTAAREQGHTALLTFGGAYSNHIRATAAAGHHYGFRTVGVIRGEQHLPLNESLARATAHGMTLTYLDRRTYRRKTDPGLVADLLARFGPAYMLPEGGSNALAVRGTAELPAEIDQDFDLICCACGTGGTLAGIAGALRPGQRALGFSALRGGQFLAGEVARLQLAEFGRVGDNWAVQCEFHFGGYARTKPELVEFAADFGARHGVRLDLVYVAKMLYGIYAMAGRGEIAPGTRVVAVITG